MRFQHNPPHIKPYDYFLSQPHQPFFLFGMLWAVIGMLLFMLGYKGILPFRIDTVSFHAYSMIFIVFTHFFHGFLLTTFPRFCMSNPFIPKLYLKIFALYEAGTFLFFAGAIFFPPLAIVGMLAIFAGQLYAVGAFRAVYRLGTAPDKRDPFWLLTAHALGLAAHITFIVGLTYDIFGFHFPWQGVAVATGIWLYLIFLTFVVAQRMVPFFSHVHVAKPPRFIPTALGLFALKALAFALDFGIADAVVSLILAGYLLREFLRWRLPLFASPAILWILHLALFWLPTGLFLGAVSELAAVWMGTSFLFAGLHLVAMGFMMTILIGFGTRVTLGHSQQVPHADRFATALFWFTQIVVITRFAYSLAMGLGIDMGWLFDLSATLWIVLFLAWGWRYGPTLFSGKKIQ